MKNFDSIDLAHSILITAAEGGIGYWCLLKDYDWADTPEGIRVQPLAGWEQDDLYPSDPKFSGDPQFTVSAHIILRTLRRLRDGDGAFTYANAAERAYFASKAAGWLADPAGADLDALAADAVFQFAALGELRYG